MARITLVDPSAASEREKTIYHRFPSNLVAGLLRTTPDIAEGYLSLGAALSSSPLSPRIREMVILRVGVLCGSSYEWMQHVDIATSVGAGPDELAAIESGDLSTLTKLERAVLRFVDDMVEQPKASTAAFDGAVAALGQQGAATVALLTGHYLMTARFLETLEIDLDAAPTSWDNA
ncbi:MAG: carboxymuconolactone decarboxylase family protein [Rhodococcus sp. (in: high G+C Gram-positive bacteria)]